MTDDVKLVVETLRYCEESGARCGNCPSGFNDKGVPNCHSQSAIADLIESLTAELEQVKRERDAAVEDLRCSARCIYCEHYAKSTQEEPCNTCMNYLDYSKTKWQWRGVKEENDE